MRDVYRRSALHKKRRTGGGSEWVINLSLSPHPELVEASALILSLSKDEEGNPPFPQH